MAAPVLCVLTAPGLPGPDLSRLVDRVRLVRATADELADQLGDAEIVLLWDFFSGALGPHWSRATRLRWIHAASAGVDSVLFEELVHSEVLLTNARGVFDRPIAEYVLGAVLAHAKRSAESLQLQHAHRWQHRETRLVEGQRALVVGTGAIGRAVARLLRAVGMSVVGAGRRARSGDPDFDEVIASERLAEHAGDVDHVIMVAPLTAATRGLVDGHVLARMKPSAQLINVGRGACVDTDALVAALGRGRPGFATLDVVEPEPLPPDHPLWDMPQVVITPHLSGDADGWRERLAAQFCDNVERYLDGRPLINVIDKSLGFSAT